MYNCTMYNRSCRLLVKLNTLKGGLECSKKNILKVSLFEHFKEQFFYIFLRTSGHCFEWTFHPVNTISLLVDGRFSRKYYNKPLCVFDISISYWWKQSIFTLFVFFSHFHCPTQVVSPLLYTLHPLPLWPRGRHLNWQQPMLETGLSRPGPSSPELDSRPHNWPTPTLPLLNSHITRTAGQTQGASMNYMMTFGDQIAMSEWFVV